ncbi:tetratricopeptide repeat protein [Solihabitans fulvus]|uniref:Tetratricopeptide repeat protein n=1 Tax=Solihabitans fulvus TaxID=1892852 RepID=A0A5B2XEY6_9PSEU|nr:tetratricopeptide repeat protein [Solihabitans fulvus]KAA2261362.1 tetratricopeptide repeat protein [Solihabitans fulvus]
MAEPITAVLLRAAELTAAGKPKKAVDLLRPALVANPEHAEAWCRLAAAHLDAGEPDPALTAAKRALVLGGDPAWAQRLAALALSELGRQQEAVVAARESVRRKPSDWRCQVVLAEVLDADPANRREAIEAAEQAVRLAPHESRAYQVLGDAAARAQDWDTAERAYRAALRLDPGDDEVRANLANLRQQHRPRGVRAGRDGGGLQRRTPETRAAATAIAGAESALWPVLGRVAVMLVGGGLLLLLAGMPTPTPLIGWFSALLVLCCVVVLARFLYNVPRQWRRLLFRLPKLRRLVGVALGVLCLASVFLLLWTVLLALGAHTLQPLVLGVLCAAVGGVLCLVGGALSSGRN